MLHRTATDAQRHPGWCGRAHVCSIDGPRGEHRSHPMTVDTAAGRLVLTRVRTRRGTDHLELRVVVDLPADPTTAEAIARRLANDVCTAVEATRKAAR